MSRLYTTEVAQATGQAAELFTSIHRSAGMVPNTYTVIGSNSPLALAAALALDAALANGSLSSREKEVIKLAVSEAAGCGYCVAAHTMVARMAGLGREAILALRHGHASGNARLDGLATFARTLAAGSGTAPAEVLEAVREAGYSDTQIVETLLVISSITFTNLVNRVNDTPIDFPAAD